MKPSIQFDHDSKCVNVQFSIEDLLSAYQKTAEKKKGRPALLSPQDLRLFRILLSVDASVEDICTALSIGRATYFRYKKQLTNE